MKLATLLLFFSSFIYAQHTKGYYITNEGERVNGYYKNTDFTDNNTFEFKNNLVGNYIKIKTEDIVEYGLGADFRFIKYTVQYDKSGIYDDNLSNIKSPEWVSSTVFLRVIAQGTATLYSYRGKEGIQFFYTVKGNNEVPLQLIYKRYRLADGKIAQNSYFKEQLFKGINCNNMPVERLYPIKYTQSDLVQFVKEFNSCRGNETVLYSEPYQGTVKVGITFFAGLNNTVFGIKDASPAIDNATALNFSAGIETALGLYSGNWEGYARLEYEKLTVNAEGTLNQGYNVLNNTYKLDINIISLQVGPRYNFILNDNSKMFLDGGMVLSFPFEKDILRESYISTPTEFEYDGGITRYEISTALSGNFGIGYVFVNRFGAEIRYRTNRNLFNGTNTSYTTHLTGLTLNLRYTVN